MEIKGRAECVDKHVQFMSGWHKLNIGKVSIQYRLDNYKPEENLSSIENYTPSSVDVSYRVFNHEITVKQLGSFFAYIHDDVDERCAAITEQIRLHKYIHGLTEKGD